MRVDAVLPLMHIHREQSGDLAENSRTTSQSTLPKQVHDSDGYTLAESGVEGTGAGVMRRHRNPVPLEDRSGGLGLALMMAVAGTTYLTVGRPPEALDARTSDEASPEALPKGRFDTEARCHEGSTHYLDPLAKIRCPSPRRAAHTITDLTSAALPVRQDRRLAKEQP